MLRLVCLAVLATCAFGGILQECKVSEWSDWGACVTEVNCPAKKGASFPLVDYDHKLNEARRAMNMNTKAMERSKTTACREAGTCPDLEIRKTSRATADCVDGIAVTDPGNMPCENINMLAFLDFDALGSYEGGNSRAGNDIWGWTDPSDGEEYSIVGVQHGSSFVRTTDPVNPEVLCFMESATNPSSWRDMKVVNDHIYIVSEATGHGMQVFDLKRLRSMNQEATVPACGPDSHYTGIGQSHNIASNQESGYVYVVGATRQGDGITTCSGGLHMIYVGIDEAVEPEFHGCFDEDGYVHDTECLFYNGPDAAYQGHEICFGYNENTLTIIDVTDKSNPIMVSRTGYDDAAYTHQGWTLGSHTALLLDDELDEQSATVGNRETRTYFWDITELEAPELKSTFFSEKQSIDHNQYIVNDFTYQSNYEAGLRILEINEAAYELTQKAYFQVRAGEPTAVFRGTWSNYPYFGTDGGAYPSYVPTTSIDYGLFILAPDYDNFSTRVTGHETRGRDALAGRGSCPALMETRTCNANPTC